MHLRNQRRVRCCLGQRKYLLAALAQQWESVWRVWPCQLTGTCVSVMQVEEISATIAHKKVADVSVLA